MATRYVLLRFDDGDRLDYDPPLLHNADIFLSRLEDDRRFIIDVGATSAVEVAPSDVPVELPPERRPLPSAKTWLD